MALAAQALEAQKARKPLEQGGSLEQVAARIERVMGLTKKLSRPPKAGRLERRVRDIFICQFGVEPNQGGCWPY